MVHLFSRKVHHVAGLISEWIWGAVPRPIQQRVSAAVAVFFSTGISRLLIRPYCLFHYGDSRYHRQFRPGRGGLSYRSFQDFFTRDFFHPPDINADAVWPCEGYLCDKAAVGELDTVKVKGQRKNVRAVFGVDGDEIPDAGIFTNVFLHNSNYHHIHAPVSGVVRWIRRIPGELLLLRPWAYRDKPSLPALTNERVNLCIEDSLRRSWFLSIVGGPVVASIRLMDTLSVGCAVTVGEKLATFELGSTCCMVSPVLPCASLGEIVAVGDALNRTVFPEQSAEQIWEPVRSVASK